MCISTGALLCHLGIDQHSLCHSLSKRANENIFSGRQFLHMLGPRKHVLNMLGPPNSLNDKDKLSVEENVSELKLKVWLE